MSALERLFADARTYRDKYAVPVERPVDINMTYQTFNVLLADSASLDPDNPTMLITTLFILGNLRFKEFEGEFQRDLLADPPEFIFDAHNPTVI